MEKAADAVEIGGGILGASLAYFLAKMRFGKEVLLENRTLAAETVGRFSEAGHSVPLLTVVEMLEHGGR